jgi:hypothetical protein
MTRVRDTTIEVFDAALDRRVKDPLLPQSTLKVFDTFTQEQKDVLVHLVPDVVTYTLAHLLLELDQTADINVVVNIDGEHGNVRELSDSLPGEIYTNLGWVKRFSTKRASRYYVSDDADVY